jgi:YgiT-type zinc finger domain-containing protein
MKKAPSGICCPTCGHPSMKHVVRSVLTKLGRRRISVPGIRVEECSKCGELLYDLAALAAIRQARRAARRGSAA